LPTRTQGKSPARVKAHSVRSDKARSRDASLGRNSKGLSVVGVVVFVFIASMFSHSIPPASVPVDLTLPILGLGYLGFWGVFVLWESSSSRACSLRLSPSSTIARYWDSGACSPAGGNQFSGRQGGLLAFPPSLVSRD